MHQMQHPMQEFLKTQLLEWFQGVDIGDPEVVLNKARLSRTFFILVIECQNMQVWNVIIVFLNFICYCGSVRYISAGS